MFWINVCVEGYCFGEEDEDGHGPCGRRSPAPYCLGDGTLGICPHFAWSATTERRVAYYPSLRLVLWDRLKAWVVEVAYWKMRWIFWDSLWFNRRKTKEFFDNISLADDFLVGAGPETALRENQEKFTLWQQKRVNDVGVTKTASEILASQ